MGRHQTETFSYLKSVLLWLQEYWTGPAVRIYPLRAVPQVSRHYSARRTHAALNRRDVIIDLPAFLPAPKLVRIPPAKDANRDDKIAAEERTAPSMNGQPEACMDISALNEVCS